MKLRYQQGGVVEVGEARAERLLATGLFRRMDDNGSQKPAEPTKAEPQGEYTGDTVQDAPALPEAPEEAPKRPAAAVVRAWAQENNVEVSPKGKVSEAVYEKYAEAHKEN